MQLKCKVCGEAEQINRTVKKGFYDIAYENIIEWSDFSDNVPPLDENKWVRSDVLPKIDEYRLVKIHFPFSFEIGEKFNALFTPAMSDLNGWEEYPEEIEKSAVISCRFDKIIIKNDYCAWISIEIIDVIMLKDMYKIYPISYIKEPLEKFDILLKIDTFKYKNWIYYSWNGQGDLGEWKLIYIDNTGTEHLILMGVWGFHENNVYCGNILAEKSP